LRAEGNKPGTEEKIDKKKSIWGFLKGVSKTK